MAPLLGADRVECEREVDVQQRPSKLFSGKNLGGVDHNIHKLPAQNVKGG
jgi:ribosomal protein L27